MYTQADPCFVLQVSYKQYINILCLCLHANVQVLESAAFLAGETSSCFGWPVGEYYTEMKACCKRKRFHNCQPSEIMPHIIHSKCSHK